MSNLKTKGIKIIAEMYSNWKTWFIFRLKFELKVLKKTFDQHSSSKPYRFYEYKH